MDIVKVAQLNREDIAAHLPMGLLSTHKIVQLGLLMGPIIFSGVIVLLHHQGGAPAERLPDEATTGTLLSIVGALCLGIYLALAILPGLYFKPHVLARRLRSRTGEDVPSMVSALANERMTFGIIRSSLFEGAAFAGLAVLLIAVNQGSLADEPQVYLAALPTAVHVVALVLGFPSKQNTTDFIADRLLRPLRRIADLA